MNRRIIAGIYVGILIVLALTFAAVSRHQKRFDIIFTYEVDYIFYEMARAITHAKDTIYEYENTLDVLYHNKKKIFTKPILSYEQQFPRIWENIRYVEELLGKKLFTQEFDGRVQNTYKTLHQIATLRRAIHTILTFWTLWIAKAFTA